MLKFICLLSLCVYSSAFAESKKDLRSYILEKMDPKISKAMTSNTRSDVVSIMGPATLAERNAVYYELEGFKYALSAQFKENKIDRIIYHPRSLKINLKDIETYSAIDIKQIKPVVKNGVEDGLEREFVDKVSKLRLVFKNTSELPVSMIEILK